MADSSPSNSTVDSYGFTRSADDYDFKTYEEFMNKYLAVLSHRSLRWSTLMNENIPVKTSRKLKRFIRKGIPAEKRPLMWMYMSGAEERKQSNPPLYGKLLQDKHDPQLIEAIKNDIHRTFPDNIYFQGGTDDSTSKRACLYNVLLAISHNNKKTGYCQGMNFITGMLLLVVKDEEKVFWLLDTLINVILPGYYTPDMTDVKVDCEVLGELIKIKCPDVYALAEKFGCAWSIVATKWFICLFVDVLPVETVLRIWDSLFFEGDKILFRVCITLIKQNSAKILKCRNFSEMMEVLRGMTSDAHVIDCHQFMENIFKEPGSLSRSLITKLREDCKRNLTANNSNN
ncbi:hypothetical protein HELRODRAFT_185724 [Helobdella robusta]|uniref:Growth hormone-regulated TBC protein 1 n=1 Tax=Helobdella robusta TaxID=6412 RepID=T1FN72_HELRO|nr:hypothetical protein HELRODRAFT_185724 [Helobdella robusta]ESO00999.1 hypothetical protein HELRODRAFT_185724 [Helobdella robusta]